MANGNKGFWAFLGAVGLTGIVSTGVMFDANKVFLGKQDTPPAAEAEAPEAEKPAEVAALPEATTPEQPVENAQPETPVAERPAVEETPAKAEQPQAAPADAATVMPRFDILRVEPDGSMVIAGSAAPESNVEVVTGSTVIATAKAGPNGDFVAVLDAPLKPGDYEVVLRSVLADGSSMASEETAVVSIPEAGGKDVLALVEAPGAPSRLITTPSADALVPATQEQPAQAEVQPAEEAAPEVAAAEPEKPVEEQPAQGEVAMGGTVETPAAEAPTADAPAAETPAAVAEAADIRIDAVEIDGKTVFVAGSAEPGTRLRIYANSILLGDTVTSPGGKFLVEVNRELPVGDYVIRADALDKAGEVVMRAAVPFTRPEGEKVAAIAVTQPPMLPATPPIVSGEVATQLPDMVPVPEGAPAETAPAESTAEANTQPAPTEGQAALVPTEQSVIIRRGDTLWQISRRVYGRGIKYTTIYLANEDQIKDPDMIWPGQVFALPEKAEDDAQN